MSFFRALLSLVPSVSLCRTAFLVLFCFLSLVPSHGVAARWCIPANNAIIISLSFSSLHRLFFFSGFSLLRLVPLSLALGFISVLSAYDSLQRPVSCALLDFFLGH